MVSFCAVLFPTRYLGRDLELNRPFSKGFPTYYFKSVEKNLQHLFINFVIRVSGSMLSVMF